MVAAVHLDQLGNRQIVLHSALLEHDPDALSQPTLPVRRIHAQHSCLTVSALSVTLEDLDDGCLTRPVWPKQTEHLTSSNL